MAFSKLAAFATRSAKRGVSRSSADSAARLLSTSAALAVTDDARFLRYNSPVPVPADFTPVLSVPETRVTTLANGVRVATESDPSAQSATVGVWFDAGSRYESAATNGTAHFLEHMIFKGTKRRTQFQLESEVENIGAHLNAFTSREMTAYYAKVVKKSVPAAVDILSDILLNPTFEQPQIERERSVILREMQEVGKQDNEVVFDHLHATAFQHCSLGRTILGSPDNVRSITQADLKDYIATHYTGPRTVVVGAGAVNHDEFVRLVEKQFSALPANPATGLDLVAKDPALYTGSDVRIRDDDMPLAHFALALKGASWTDPDAVALMVMHSMLGSYSRAAGGGVNLGSRLASDVAANSLAEQFQAFNTNYKDTGLFGVYCVAPPNTLEDLSWCIMQSLTGMVYRVNEDDVTRAKNQLKSSLLLHLDGSSSAAEDMGRQLLMYGRRLPLAELVARIDAVDGETVKRVADRFIYDKDVVLAAMGPIQFLPDYNWLRRRTYWLRY